MLHLFLCSCFWLSLSLVPLIRHLLVHRNWCVCFVKLFQKSGFCSLLWISYKNRECFNFNHSSGNLLFFIHFKQTSRSGLSFQLADLLCLFIIITIIILFRGELKQKLVTWIPQKFLKLPFNKLFSPVLDHLFLIKNKKTKAICNALYSTLQRTTGLC